MRTRRLARIRARLGYTAVALLVLVALALTAVRVTLHRAEGIDAWAEGLLGDALGVPLTVDQVEARLDGLSPALELRGVRLGEGERRLELRALRLTLDSWRSLVRREPVLTGLTVVGGHVRVTRLADGDILVQGRRESLLAELPFPDRLRLVDFAVDFRNGGRDARPLRLRGLSLEARPVGGGPHARGEVRLPGLGATARFVFAFDEKPRRGRPIRGETYLDVRDLPVAPVRGRVAPGLDAPAIDGRLDARLWASWGAGGLEAVTLDGRARDLRVGGTASLASLAGRLRWQRQGDGWRLDARERSRGPAGHVAPPLTLSLVRGTGPDGGGWRLGASEVDIARALDLATAAGLAESPAVRALAARAPQGRLRRLSAGWSARPGGPWHAEASLESVAFAPADGQPGAEGLDAIVRAGPRGGRVDVSARNGRVVWPGVFREPLPLGRLDAEGGWRRWPDGMLAIHLPAVDWRTPIARARGELNLWTGTGDGPVVDMRLRLGEAAVTAVPPRLPADRLPPKLLGWLDGALTGGRVTGGDVLLRGPLAAFPFRGGEGVFRVAADFRDAGLRYRPEWPALADLSGRMTLTGTDLAVRVDGGRTGELRIREGRATIADFREAELAVDATVDGGAGAMLSLLERTPLTLPAFVDEFAIAGEPTVSLGLGLPLKGGDATVSGSVRVTDATVTHRGSGYRLAAVNGAIGFDRDGLEWNGVTARLGGERVASKGWTEGSGAGARIRSVTRFTAGPGALVPPGASAPRTVSGRTDWRLAVNAPGFRAADRAFDVALNSDLQGLSVDGPPPFGKPADYARAFTLAVSGAGGELAPVRVRYGDDVRALLDARGAGDLRRVAVTLGGEAPTLPEGPGLTVSGRLPELDAGRLAGYAGQRPATGDSLPALRRVDLSLDRLIMGRYAVNGLRVTARPADGGWRVGLDGEGARGRITLPAGDGGAVAADLERLAVQTRAEGDAWPPGEPSALNIRIGRLSVNGRPLGRVVLRYAPVPTGAELRELVVDNAAMRLSASGRWDRRRDRSTLSATLETVDAGAVLERFGYARSIEGGEGHAAAELQWPGRLTEPSVAGLGGRAELLLRDGSLPAVEPGAGRVFGLLSLSLLPRRLMLDFSDVIAEGLPFDRVEAVFALENGVARPETFTIAGPVATIEVAGAVDLAGREYDQVITVAPRVTSTLPLLGGLAAGPQTAMLLWLGQKLLQPGVERLTSLRYRLTGEWSDPRLHHIPDEAPGNPPPSTGERP